MLCRTYLDLQTGSFTLLQIKAATNNFNSKNKIGEGGFGPVYKVIYRNIFSLDAYIVINIWQSHSYINFYITNLQGRVSDGTIIAVKQLSSKSKQGNREFVTEIGMISALQHPNLVQLYGCCTEGDQLLLVYEYMENNSLARALFGKVSVIYFSAFFFVFLNVKTNRSNYKG